MTIRLSPLPKDPRLGYAAQHIAYMAAVCMQCPRSAPCTLACSRKANIPQSLILAGQAACESLPLTHWLWDQEKAEATRITNAIMDAYN